MKISSVKKFIAFSLALVFIAGPALRSWAAEEPAETPSVENASDAQAAPQENPATSEQPSSSSSSSGYDKAAAQAAVNEARQKAEELSNQLASTQEKTKELNKILEQAQAHANDAVAGAQTAAADYSTAKGKLNAVLKSISSTNEEIAGVESNIADIGAQIAATQKLMDEQYAAMKKRIQFMYEGGNKSILAQILTSGSMMAALNKAQYVLELTSYDRKQMTLLEETKAHLDAQKAKLDEEQSKLNSQMSELNVKQSIAGDLLKEAGITLTDAVNEATSAAEQVGDYEKQIAEMEAEEKRLASAYADAQLELARQIAELNLHEDLSGGLDGYTEDDVLYMAAIIQAEAGGENHDGKLAVGSVVMNRLKSSRFPNSVAGVIMQNRQFEPVTTGRFALILSNGPNSTCIGVAKEVLNGARNTDALFFMTTALAEQKAIFDRTVGTIYDHQYFYNYAN